MCVWRSPPAFDKLLLLSDARNDEPDEENMMFGVARGGLGMEVVGAGLCAALVYIGTSEGGPTGLGRCGPQQGRVEGQGTSG